MSTSRPTLFVPLRLATYIVLMGVLVFWTSSPKFLQWTAIIYSVSTLALALGIAYERKHLIGAALKYIIGLQFLLEIAIEAGIIYLTGNLSSAFSAIFVLTVVSASLCYRLFGTVIMASLVSIVYTLSVWLSIAGIPHSSSALLPIWEVLSPGESAFYSVFLHLLIFYLVAFMSGYLAERISDQGERLAHASRELRKAKLETDDILRHLNSGLLTIDPIGKIIYFNRAAEKILGLSEISVRGRNCQEVFSEKMPQFGNALIEAIEDGITHPRKEITIIDSDDNEVPLGLSTSILREGENHIRGVIAIFSDLTDAKQLEEKVRLADRLAAVGELSASIAHEIRNPLAAISGSVEVLSGELELQADNKRLMQVIVRESRRLNKILTDFLAFASIDRRAYDKVELCHVLNDVVELLRNHSAFGENIELELSIVEPVAYVVGDEDLIRQLLQNLLINACEAIDNNPGKVSLELVLDSHRDEVTVIVSDNGPGIDLSNQEKIFKPFFSTKKQGTGLGLAIVHRICTALGLGIIVESQPGHGTTFRLRFPLYNFHRSKSNKTDKPIGSLLSS